MSTVTFASAVTLVLSLTGLFYSRSSLGFESFGVLCLVSIPVLLTSVGGDVRRGRYWAVGLIAFFVASGAVLVWLVTHATPLYW